MTSQVTDNLKHHTAISVNKRNRCYGILLLLKSRSAALFLRYSKFSALRIALSNGSEWGLQSVLDKPFLRRYEYSLQLLRQKAILVLTKREQFHFIWIGNHTCLWLNFIVKRKPHPTYAIKINFQRTYTPNEILKHMCIHEFTHPIFLNVSNSYHSYIAKLIARHMTQDNYKIIPVFLNVY